MDCKTPEESKNLSNSMKDIIKSDLPDYLKITSAYVLFFLIWLGIAIVIDLNSAGGTRLTKEMTTLVAAEPLKLLIGMYAITIGLWTMLGGRSNQSYDAVKLSEANNTLSVYNRLRIVLLSTINLLFTAAKFSKDTTFIFLGLLIASSIISTVKNFSDAWYLILSIVVATVFFFIYGLLDFLAKNLLRSKESNVIIGGDFIAGMILISLFLPIVAFPF